jgi:hypothetical protein
MNLQRQFVHLLVAVLYAMAGCTTDAGSGEMTGDCKQLTTEGGPCTYIAYQGEALITRVVQTSVSKEQSKVIGGPGYEGFEVWFRFAAERDRKTPNQPAPVTDREHLLTLRNGWYMGPEYLAKYALSPGQRIPCVLNVIETGVCAPIHFQFSTIQVGDYFESRSR